MTAIALTPGEAKQVAWALDPMRDCVDDENFAYGEEDLPEVTEDVLTIPETPGALEVVGDLLYRLSVQLPEMVAEVPESERPLAVAGMRSARQVVEKLRAAFPRAEVRW